MAYTVSPDVQRVHGRLFTSVQRGGRVGRISHKRVDRVRHLTKGWLEGGREGYTWIRTAQGYPSGPSA